MYKNEKSDEKFCMHPHGHSRGSHALVSDCADGIPRRLARAFILLFLAEGPSHGYEIARSFRESMPKGFCADPSVLYRMLKSMEEEGLMTSSLEESTSGPPRKVYSLTDDGYEALDMWASGLDGLSELLADFQKRYGRLRKGGK
ncbi:MAG: PadR family transcriptional regulator [Actinomycetota bacterium]|nr:PadR family transcriptional regulator [Actinomycetota bacterium]